MTKDPSRFHRLTVYLDPDKPEDAALWRELRQEALDREVTISEVARQRLRKGE